MVCGGTVVKWTGRLHPMGAPERHRLDAGGGNHVAKATTPHFNDAEYPMVPQETRAYSSRTSFCASRK